ncbi:MAG: hypothetical protein AAFX99_13160, partial [Myxococcota bacterium]
EDAFYTKPGCPEDTLNPECANPCDGYGWFNGYHCLVEQGDDGRDWLSSPGGTLNYRYFTSGGPVHCDTGDDRQVQALPGNVYLTTCTWLNPRSDRSYFVYNNDLYTQPLCSTTAGLPNCGQPCSANGSQWALGDSGWDCDAGPIPDGASPFIYLNATTGLYGLYTSAASTAPYCPHQPDPDSGYSYTWDTANCQLRYEGEPVRIEQGTNARIVGHRFFYDAACGATPDWQNPYGGAAAGTLKTARACKVE